MKGKGWRHWDGPGAAAIGAKLENLYQGNLKDEILACERVIGIEHDVRLCNRRDHRCDGRAILPTHLELLSNRGPQIGWKMMTLNLYDPLSIMWSIRLIAGNHGRSGLACHHPQHGLLETRDQLSLAKGKLQGLPLYGRVEQGAVCQLPSVMDSDNIPSLRLCHNHNPLVSHGQDIRMGKWQVHVE